MRQRRFSKTHRLHLKQARLGKKHSPKTREKMSQSQLLRRAIERTYLEAVERTA